MQQLSWETTLPKEVEKLGGHSPKRTCNQVVRDHTTNYSQIYEKLILFRRNASEH